MKRCQSGCLQGGIGVVCVLLVFLLWGRTGHAAQATHFIDYLYVEANEGDSSGGHAALRFGSETYHFQHEAPGILRIRRIESAAFNHAYAMLGNRTIRESRIAVAADTYDLLRDAFSRLYLIQDAQLELRETLRRDAALFELLLRQNRARPSGGAYITLPLKGLGYFLADEPSPEGVRPQALADNSGGASRSPALLKLQNRIHAVHGADFIAARLSRARVVLRELELRAAEPAVATISPDGYPAFFSSAASSYENALQVLYALEVLQAAAPLRPGTFRTSAGAAFRLEPQDALALQAFAERLAGELVGLVNSSRTDWGFPFVLGMARLAAIEASLSSGQLVFLDVFPAAEQTPSLADDELRPYFPAMAREKEAVFLRRRGDFFTDNRMREADYASLERAGNLLLELEQAVVSGSGLRSEEGTFFPARQANLSVPVPGHMDTAYLTRQLTAGRAVERDYQAALDRLYAYNLVQRNCVTEIFAVINHALAERTPAPGGNGHVPDPAAAVRKEAEQRLGGFIDASHGLTFIPFVSADAVATSYAVAAGRDLPSYRALRLAEMKRHEAPLTVFLRESNTLTSTVYSPRAVDSKFLFFTDDSLLLRPLFGVFNLLTGLGESLAGIVTLPVAGPERLLAGTRGVLFSLPELVFVNIRKGSMAYVEKSAETYR